MENVLMIIFSAGLVLLACTEMGLKGFAFLMILTFVGLFIAKRIDDKHNNED